MSVVYLTGILEDGAPPDPALPTNARELLGVTQASTTQVFVRCVTRGGVPVTEGDLVLRVKQRPGDEPPLAQLTGTWVPLTGPGCAVFTFTPSLFNGVPWGRYLYDVTLTQAGVVNRLIPAAPFLLRPAV